MRRFRERDMSEGEAVDGKFEALSAPPGAIEKGGVEVLRAAIVEGGLHVALQRAFEEPDAWGILLADVARHVGRIFAAEDGVSEDDVVARVRMLFEAELDRSTDSGTTGAVM